MLRTVYSLLQKKSGTFSSVRTADNRSFRQKCITFMKPGILLRRCDAVQSGRELLSAETLCFYETLLPTCKTEG